ncbi:Putative transport protein [Neolewinella maritima]|uniref:Transport protein n=1 Tax=Neolewinella maritima TaxID=1383882 RepID=A0ABM9AVS3_9BACT|nr:AI-2E family transporter [Neolewinella maritima]CAH0998741.1 Putative transport protein [Neolewinella maritima]
MQDTSKLQAYVWRLAAVIGTVVVLYYGQGVVLLLVIAGLIAMLLNPIDNKLRSWGWKSGFAIAGAVCVLLLFFAALFFAVGKQATRFADNWPKIEERISEQVAKAREQIAVLPGGGGGGDTAATGGAAETQDGGGTSGSVISSLPIGGKQITGALSGTLSILGDFLLMLVYVVLFLAQKERLYEFVLRRAPDTRRAETKETMNEASDVAQNYLKGRLILILILSVLYGVGFSIVGLDYAIVVAVLVAVLSIIPYLGNIIGGVLAMAIAIAGGGGTDMILGILATMAVAQLLESYILTPLIVGDEVDINPLTTIVAVIAFTVMWGPVGAIVAIPLVAILRVLCMHVEGLKDYAYLLGQE